MFTVHTHLTRSPRGGARHLQLAQKQLQPNRPGLKLPGCSIQFFSFPPFPMFLFYFLELNMWPVQILISLFGSLPFTCRMLGLWGLGAHLSSTLMAQVTETRPSLGEWKVTAFIFLELGEAPGRAGVLPCLGRSDCVSSPLSAPAVLAMPAVPQSWKQQEILLFLALPLTLYLFVFLSLHPACLP